MQPFVKNQKST